eukprot:36045-Eustigmatos_ZCMA.PRE.1
MPVVGREQLFPSSYHNTLQQMYCVTLIFIHPWHTHFYDTTHTCVCLARRQGPGVDPQQRDQDHHCVLRAVARLLCRQ